MKNDKCSFLCVYSAFRSVVSMKTRFIVLLVFGALAIRVTAQTATPSPTPSPTSDVPATSSNNNESERSDKFTGGHIETAEFTENEPDIRLTLNIPSFRLT